MTKIVIVEADYYDKRPQLKLAGAYNPVIEGAVNADCSFKKGWHPKGAGQWMVRNVGEGQYVVYHHLNRVDYGVSCSTVGEASTIQVVHSDETCFKVSMPKNMAFRFALTFVIKYPKEE